MLKALLMEIRESMAERVGLGMARPRERDLGFWFKLGKEEEGIRGQNTGRYALLIFTVAFSDYL